jgi:hypothetical protein
MSRSFKKTPIMIYGKFCKDIKHWFNKKIRIMDIDDNGAYKKAKYKYGIYNDTYHDNLLKTHKVDGIPTRYGRYSNEKLTIEEIDKYWRK